MKRIAYLDALRVLSCLAIISIHSMGGPIDAYAQENQWLFRSLVDSVNRFAVPVFFMISGALYLNRECAVQKRFFSGIFLKYFLPTFFAFALYKAIDCSFRLDADYVRGILWPVQTKSGYHLWFMPIYIGIILSLPILVKIARDAKVELYFIALWIVFTVICDTALRLNSDFSLALIQNPLFFTYTGYFFLGHYLHRQDAPAWNWPVPWLLFAAAFSLLGICLTTYQASLIDKRYTGVFLVPPSPFVLAYAASIFVVFKKMLPGGGEYLSLLARHTFGIYLLHLALVRMIKSFVEEHSGIYNLFFASIVMPGIVYAILFALFSAVDRAKGVYGKGGVVKSHGGSGC